jgi:hypothetical protein
MGLFVTTLTMISNPQSHAVTCSKGEIMRRGSADAVIHPMAITEYCAIITITYGFRGNCLVLPLTL